MRTPECNPGRVFTYSELLSFTERREVDEHMTQVFHHARELCNEAPSFRNSRNEERKLRLQRRPNRDAMILQERICEGIMNM